jgi:S-adenosylmethionine-dependent methyltransferase
VWYLCPGYYVADQPSEAGNAVIDPIADVGQLLDALTAVLAPGGLLSLVSVNRYSAPYGAAFLHQDLERAYASLDSDMQLGYIFDTAMRLFTAEEIGALLRERGFAEPHHYGVRCLCDYWGTNEQKQQPAVMAQLERLERRLADRHPYKLLARYFHLLARRGAAS